MRTSSFGSSLAIALLIGACSSASSEAAKDGRPNPEPTDARRTPIA